MPSLGEYLGGSLQRASARVLPYWMDKQQLARQGEQDAYQKERDQIGDTRIADALAQQKEEFEYTRNRNRQQDFLEMMRQLEQDRQAAQPQPEKLPTGLEGYAIWKAERGGDDSMLKQLLTAKTDKGQGGAKGKTSQPSVPNMLGKADWLGRQGGLDGAIRSRQDLNAAVTQLNGLPGFPGWSVMGKPPVGGQLRQIQSGIMGVSDQGGYNPMDYEPAQAPPPPPNDGSFSDEEYQEFVRQWANNPDWWGQ